MSDFLLSIQVYTTKNGEKIKRENKIERNFDYKSSLDVEIKIKNSIISLPNNTSSLPLSSSNINNNSNLNIGRYLTNKNNLSCLCFYIDCDYSMALRGFLQGE